MDSAKNRRSAPPRCPRSTGARDGGEPAEPGRHRVPELVQPHAEERAQEEDTDVGLRQEQAREEGGLEPRSARAAARNAPPPMCGPGQTARRRTARAPPRLVAIRFGCGRGGLRRGIDRWSPGAPRAHTRPRNAGSREPQREGRHSVGRRRGWRPSRTSCRALAYTRPQPGATVLPRSTASGGKGSSGRSHASARPGRGDRPAGTSLSRAACARCRPRRLRP